MDGLQVEVEGADKVLIDEGAAALEKVTIVSPREATVVDSTGRTIRVKKLSALDRMRLFRVAGPEDSDNRSMMIYFNLAASAVHIAGMDYPFPMTKLQIEGRVQSLDDHGLEAVAVALKALTPTEEDLARAAKNL
jgi:hypothetical protein